MPPVHGDGPQVGTEGHPDALNATTTAKITRSPVKGRRQRATSQRRYPRNWAEISKAIRFGRAHGRCECTGECGTGHQGRCEARHGQPHLVYDADQHRATAAWARAGRPVVQLELFAVTGAAA